MTYANFAKLQASEKITLVHLHGKQEVKVFNTTGSLHTRTPLSTVTEVLVNGVSYVSVTTVPTTNEFNYNFTTNELTIFFAGEIAAQEVILNYRFFFSNSQIQASFDLSNNGALVDYKPRIISIPQFTTQLSFATANKTITGSGQLVLNNSDGFFNELFKSIRFDNKNFVVYSWSPTLSFSERRLVYEGVLHQASLRNNNVSFSVKDSIFNLNNTIELKNFTTDEVPQRSTNILKKQVFGKVESMKVLSTDQIGDGTVIEGDVSIARKSNVLVGKTGNFQQLIARGDTVTIGTTSFRVSNLVNGFAIILSEESDVSLTDTRLIVKPGVPWYNTNRDYSVAEHALKRFEAVLSNFDDRRRILVDTTEGFEVGDKVSIANETYTLRQVTTFIKDSIITPTLVLDRTLSANNLPVIGSKVIRKEISDIKLRGISVLEKDITINNVDGGESSLTLSDDAEINITQFQDIEDTLTRYAAIPFIFAGNPSVNLDIIIGSIPSLANSIGTSWQLPREGDINGNTGEFFWLGNTINQTIRNFTVAQATAESFIIGDVYRLTDASEVTKTVASSSYDSMTNTLSLTLNNVTDIPSKGRFKVTIVDVVYTLFYNGITSNTIKCVGTSSTAGLETIAASSVLTFENEYFGVQANVTGLNTTTVGLGVEEPLILAVPDNIRGDITQILPLIERFFIENPNRFLIYSNIMVISPVFAFADLFFIAKNTIISQSVIVNSSPNGSVHNINILNVGTDSGIDTSFSSLLKVRDVIGIGENSIQAGQNLYTITEVQDKYVRIISISAVVTSESEQGKGFFKSPVYNTDTSLVTVDCLGKTTDGNALGDWIKTPGDAINNVLIQNGLSGRINTASIDTANTLSDITVGIYIPYLLKQRAPTVLDFVNKTTITTLGALGLDNDFNLKLQLLNGGKPVTLETIRVISNNELLEKAQDEIKASSLFRYTVSNINGQYNFGEDDPLNDFFNISNPTIRRLIDINTNEEVDFYTSNLNNAKIIGNKYLDFSQRINRIFTLKGSISLQDIEIGQIVLLDLIEIEDLNNENIPTLGMVTYFSRNGNSITVKVEDIGGLFIKSATMTNSTHPTFTNSNNTQRLLGTFMTDNNGLINNTESTFGNNVMV